MQINVKLTNGDLEQIVSRHLEAHGMKLVKCESVVEKRNVGNQMEDQFHHIFTGLNCEVEPTGDGFIPLKNTIIRNK